MPVSNVKKSAPKLIPAKDGLVPYLLYRSDRRSVSIEVTPPDGTVVVRIPRRMAQDHAEDFIRANLDKIESRIHMIQNTAPTPMETALSDTDIRKLRALAARTIPARVEFWTKLSELPMPDRISFTAAQKRFGSCRKYPDGRVHLCFSYRLMQYPAQAIDAVILHEVAHIVHMNHSRAFYDFIARYMPDYEARHALLKHS